MDKLREDLGDCDINDDDFSFAFVLAPESAQCQPLASTNDLKNFVKEAQRKLYKEFDVRFRGFAFPLAFQTEEKEQIVGLLTCRHLFFEYECQEKIQGAQEPTIPLDVGVKFFEVNDGFPKEVKFEQNISSAFFSKRKDTEMRKKCRDNNTVIRFVDGGLDYALLPIPDHLHSEIKFCEVSSHDEVGKMKQNEFASVSPHREVRNMEQNKCALVSSHQEVGYMKQHESALVSSHQEVGHMKQKESALVSSRQEDGYMEQNEFTLNLQIFCGLSMLQRDSAEEVLQQRAEGSIVEKKIKDSSLQHTVESIQGMSGTPIFSRRVKDDGLDDVQLVGMIDHLEYGRKGKNKYFGKLICGIQKKISEKIAEMQKTEEGTAFINKFVSKSESILYCHSNDVASYPLWAVGFPEQLNPVELANKVDTLQDEITLLKNSVKRTEEREKAIVELFMRTIPDDKREGFKKELQKVVQNLGEGDEMKDDADDEEKVVMVPLK